MHSSQAALQLEYNQEYRSGPDFSHADVHGGGILFGVVIRQHLVFHRNRTLNIWNEVLDSFAQMEGDARQLSQLNKKVHFSVTDRGYIEFKLNKFHYYGSPCPNQPTLLAFDVTPPRGDLLPFGIAYELTNG